MADSMIYIGIPCPICGGTGRVSNPYFQECIGKEDEYPDDYPGDCGYCKKVYPYRHKHCLQGETIQCDFCFGSGEVA